jgi:hypothetical protein
MIFFQSEKDGDFGWDNFTLKADDGMDVEKSRTN